MSLDLNKFKKATSSATTTPAPKIDLNAFKVQKQAENPSLLKKYQTATVDIAKNTSAYGFEGVSRAAGGFTELTGRAVALASKGAGKVGSGIYKGIGNVVGLFSEKGEVALDKVAEDFKKNQYQFADRFKTEGQKINSFLSKAGADSRDILLKTDKEAYDAREKKLQERGDDTEFSVKDMTEADFWVHDIYGGLLQNAPTMALSLYAGGGAGASNTVLNFLAKAGTATAFSTGINASIEAESAYSSALDEGKSEEEAIAEADRVFKRNSIANSGLEAAQMMLLFAPQMKFASPVINALLNTGKLGTAGVLEAGQERIEDNIQDQASNENFDFDALTESLMQKGISRTDAVAFVLGVLFQGGGNVFVDKADVEKAAKQQVEEIAALIPDDGEGGTAEARVERAIENDPDTVTTAVDTLNNEITTTTDRAREEARVERLTDFAQEAIDAGKSPAEVVVALSGQIPTTRAQEIVENIEPRANALANLPTAEELMETSPAKLQQSLESLDADVKKNTAELKTAIERLQAEVKAAPKNSKEKLDKKKELETTRAELRKVEKDFRDQIEQGGVEARRTVERYIIDNTTYSRAEQRALSDRIVKKIFNAPVDVPITTVIKNELRKFAPATATKQPDIEAAIAKVTTDKKRQAQLLDEALEVLQDKDFEAVVSDMTIDEVITELVKQDGQFQVANTTRKPTGKAKFKNIKNDDLANIAAYIDAVRSDSDFSFTLETAVKRLAERYGLNPEQSMKQLALAFERLIDRNNMDERVDALLLEAKEKETKTKEQVAKTENKAQTKAKKEEPKMDKTTKPLPAWVKQQLEGLPFMKNVPVSMVERISTPEGYEAFGRYINGTVQFVENPDKTTIPHESFHVHSQLALTSEERRAMYDDAQAAYADPQLTTDLATEERLAQDFAEWYVTEKNPANFSDRLIGYFRKIKDFILDFVRPQNSAKLREIFASVLDESVVARVNASRKTARNRFFQGKNIDPDKTLISLHNLSADNLVKADQIGGLANPSVAILDPEKKTLTGFGEITLLGSRDLIESAGAKTYAADVYSPRFPDTENTYDYSALERFEKANGVKLNDIDLERFAYQAHRSDVLKHLFLQKEGLVKTIPEDISYELRQKYSELITKNDVKFKAYLTEVAETIKVKERIFLGYTPSGTRRYTAVTAENASKIMKKAGIRSGESFFYGLGSIRSQLAPQFRTVAKMKKETGRLVSAEEFAKVKEEYEAEFNALMEELVEYRTDGGHWMADIGQDLGLHYAGDRTIFRDFYPTIPAELVEKVNAFGKKLGEMPTEYFETKFTRVVQIDEFEAAVVPANLPETARKVLERYGIPVYEYKTEADRTKVVKQAATAKENLLFQLQTDGQGGKKISKERQEEIIKSLPKELQELARVAATYEDRYAFYDAYTADSLFDLSDPAKHRFGRLLEDGVVEDTGYYHDLPTTLEMYAEQFAYEKDANVPFVSDPDEMVTIYRSTVKGQKRIEVGDFVSFSKDYALMHNNGENLLEMQVPAKDVVWQTNDFNEWVYSPERIRGKRYQGGLESLWDKVHGKQVFPDDMQWLVQKSRGYKTAEQFLTRYKEGWFQTDEPISDEVMLDIWYKTNNNTNSFDTLYQLKEEDPEESSIMKELAEQLEQIMFEVETMFELSEAGYRLTLPHDATRSGSPVVAVESTFPKWIPEHLRSRELMDKVLTQINNNEEPRGTRQAELHKVIEEYVLNRLPSYLQDEKVLLDYFAEQQKVEDALRRDALNLMKSLAIRIADRPAVLKKGEVKNVIRTNTGQIRTDTKEFSRKFKERARFFNRGYKKGYKQGASEKFAQMLEARKLKRDRNSKMNKVKSIYRRVRQATRTGAYLPIEYQERLTELFADFDMTKMNKSTQEKLSNMAIYFAQQEGEVPADIAKKLERISKFAIGEMTDEQLTQFVDEVSRIYENGVLKKKLMDRKDEKAFAAKVKKVVDSTTATNKGKLNLSTFDPTRFADMLDGGTGRYTGANFKEIVEPLRVVTDQADIEANALLAESLEEIGSLGNSFSEEEMARMMHASALEQGAPDQAEALAIQYKDFDFVSALTEKERGALEIMKETFKEIRPEVAATYEEINNIPFPDNPNYFPFRYDKEVEKFDITEADFFDFKPAKTASGFTMQRQQGVNRVLDINIFQTFAQQVQAQVYYAKVQPVLNTSKDIVNSKPYQAQITSAEQEYWRTFLADVATRGRRGGSENAEIKAFAGKIRQNINAAILGYKLSTVLIQPTAIFDAMSNIRKDLGMVSALKVLPQFVNMMFNPRALNAAREQSIALQTRAGGQIELKELQDAQKGMFNDSPWRRGYAAFQRYAYAGIKFTDMRTAAAVLETTRREYVKKGMSKEDAMLRAEQIMMLSQASSNIANRPQFFNSEGTKFLLPFQTFVVNAFNNVRYDAVATELKEKGAVRGTISAGLNLQFFVYAIAAEALLRELYGALWGYEDEEEKSWLEKWFVSAIGRLPAINYLIKYDGEFTGEVNIDHPAIQATDRVLNLLAGLAASATEEKELGDISPKDVYQAARGLLTLLGVAGTQQLHQILTAPEIAGFKGIGMDLGIAFDDRTNVEKRADVTAEVFKSGEPLTEATITQVAEQVYGKDYKEGDAQYRADKNLEVIKELTVREAYGFEDEFVNTVLGKKSNNEVKAYVAANEVDLKAYSRPLKQFGVTTELLSDQLIKELMYIERATPAEREKIAALASAEDDEERRAIIDGDKTFAKKAFSQYKIIPKAFYESI